MAVMLACSFFASAACHAPIRKLDAGTSKAAEELFAALGARVTAPARNVKYDSARVKIAEGALLPGRVWNDTAVWTSATAARRTLLVGGRFADGRYHLEALRSVPTPARPAESRHVINLTHLADDQYAWDTDVVFALGSATAPQIGAFVAALFSSAEGRTEAQLRAEYAATIPRMSAALGQLFSLDSIRTSHLPDRSTLAAFWITLTPGEIEKRYPNFARYMRRYGQTARMRFNLMDALGATYFEWSARDGRMQMRVRTHAGVLVPIEGPTRQMPESLTLKGELAMKVRAFTVGFRDYRADFTVVRGDGERTWSIVSRREPQWELPFITERLLRTPLRRPFQGSGAMFRIGVRDDTSGQTMLHRRLHLEVQESLILRFIGRLGAIAVSDYTGRAEREQYEWLREVFDGLVADVRAMH